MNRNNITNFPDDFLKKEIATPKFMHRTLKIRILNILASLNVVDNFLQKRAVEMIELTKMMDYIKKDGVYLDIGTGLGHIVEQVVERIDVNFFATEPMWKPLKKLIKRLKQKNRNVHFMKNGGDNLPIKSGTLDGVFLYFVLHHIPYDIHGKIIDEINRLLKQDGILFIAEDVPASAEERKRIEKWDARINRENKADEHFYRYDEEWITFLNEKNFDLIENIYFQHKSEKSDEGVIPHRCYILKRKNST